MSTKYYCPCCGSEVKVTKVKDYDKVTVIEVIVTCNTCYINARGFNEQVLNLFHDEVDLIKADCRVRFVKSFSDTQEQLALAFADGLRAAKDEDYKQARFDF